MISTQIKRCGLTRGAAFRRVRCLANSASRLFVLSFVGTFVLAWMAIGVASSHAQHAHGACAHVDADVTRKLGADRNAHLSSARSVLIDTYGAAEAVVKLFSTTFFVETKLHLRRSQHVHRGSFGQSRRRTARLPRQRVRLQPSSSP